MIQHELKTAQDKLESFDCDECPYSTIFKWNLKAHKRKHKLEKQYKCDHCSYATAYRHNYMKHSKVHNKQEVIFKCDKCPFVTKYEGHISRHLAKIHNEVSEKANRCDLCDFSTKVRWRLNVHKRRSKQKNIIKCSSCEFETSYMCESKKHKSKHYNDAPDYKLNESSGEMSFDVPEYEPPPNPVIDDANISVHEKSNNYMLDPDCEIDWKSIRVIDSKCKDRPYQCVMCKYTSRFKASVQRHFQRHHTGNENRPYKCVNCDFSTKTKDQIALHNKRSQSESELVCRECPYTTLFKCQFVTHQKNHYPHKCTECNYSCKHKYEIQKHVSTMHMGNGLKCRFCDFKASRKESLLCHETIHTGNKPFKCKFCDYKSVRKSLLDNHVKRHHSDVCHNPVIVADSKIESLKIPVGDKVSSSDIIQNIREQNISLEDILDSPVVKDFAAIMNSTPPSNNGSL